MMDIKIVKKRFFDTAVADVLRAMDGRALVGATALGLCVIDYLAYMRPVDPKNRNNYEAFVRDAMEVFEPRYNPKWIYALRCSLVHTYAHADAMKNARLSGYLLRHLRPDFHLSGNDDVLRLNVESFITDVVRAAWRFFSGPPINPPVDPHKVKECGDNLLIIGLSNAEVDKPYHCFHSALKELDNAQPNFDNLYTDIREILLKNKGA